MQVDDAFEAIRNHPALPSPHGTALEILHLASNPDCSLADIAKMIEADPAMTARILKVVNSSAFTKRRAVQSVVEAVAYLGMRMVKCIALNFSLVTADRRCRSFDYANFWSNSFACAIAGSRIAQELKQHVPDEVFTLGLLSQIGRLALAAVFPTEYDTMLSAICYEHDSELRDAENILFNIDHNELTARLLETWGLPPSAAQAVRLQYAAHEADFDLNDENNRLAGILALAGTTADQITQQKNANSNMMQWANNATRFGLSATTMLEITQFVIPQWQETLNLLDIRALNEKQTQAIYAQAAQLKQEINCDFPESHRS
ncbi:MAG: HDOD domain-containing protein [Phycisphaerae bacterium]|nr:HDOD domain-containing protein [Phycisphaerae bacterium]